MYGKRNTVMHMRTWPPSPTNQSYKPTGIYRFPKGGTGAPGAEGKMPKGSVLKGC